MKALKIIGTVVAVVGILAVTAGTAFPAVAAIATTAASVAGIAAGAIGVASALFAPKPTFSQQGNPLQFQTNPQSGLPYAIGRTRMSGLRIHAETYDGFHLQSKDDILSFAVMLSAGGESEEIESFTADKEAVTFDGSGNGTGGFVDFMAQKVSLGAIGASALALSFGGAGFPGWDSAHKLSGIAHALWDLRYDSKGEHYGAGVPEPAWIGKWVKAYDPRLDSTYPGGSGAHRALDESTYEWSNNPALHALTWALGRWQNDKRTLGIGAPVGNIRVADFVEAANVADANGWTCGGVEYSTDTKWSTLKRMLQAGGAEPTMTGAMIGCRVNTPRVSIATVEAADLLDGLTIAATRSRRDRFNSVIPRYRSEDHDWEVISGAPVTVPTYVTEDGGQRTKEIDFPLVQAELGQSYDGNVQAGQLAAYEIVNSREAGPWTFTTGPKYFAVKTGDCITLNVPGEGIASQPVIVREVRRDPATLKFTFTVETETTDKHDFALGKTSVPPPTWTPTPPDLTPPTPDASLWSLTATLPGLLPAIVIAGVCEFPGADFVLSQYRKVGDPDWIPLAPQNASEPVNLIVTQLDPETDYEAQVSYKSDQRQGGWLTLDPVTTGSGDIITAIENFNDRNDRDGSSIATPTIATGGSAVDHVLGADGSADISFEWSWSGDEDTIDGFEVMTRSSTSASSYNVGDAPAEEGHVFVKAFRRAHPVYGADPTKYYTFAVRAYREVDADIESAGVIYSGWAQPTRTEEDPYRPASAPVYQGDFLGTIDGVPASDVADGTTNFNARNDRLATTVVAPTIPSGGSAVDHTLNDDGSADISLEWAFSGSEADIDGFQVLVYSSTSTSTYTLGTTAALERVSPFPPFKRAAVFEGMPANRYYTFAVRAYRVVDPDVTAGGLLYSTWARPSSGDSENPYRPSANVAFLGDVAGTISTLPRMVPAGDLNVYRRWDAAYFDGEFPVAMKFTRKKGETDVSASATWTIDDAWPGTTGLTLSSSGLLTIAETFASAGNPDAWIIIKSVYESVSETHLVRVNSIFAPPPNGIADHTVFPDAVDGAKITNSSAPGDLLWTAQCEAGASGVIHTCAIYWGWAVDGSNVPAGDITFTFRYRTAGVGSYTDGPTASQQVYSSTSYPKAVLAGLSAGSSITGLTPDAEYDIQLYAYRHTGGSWDATTIRCAPRSVVLLGV